MKRFSSQHHGARLRLLGVAAATVATLSITACSSSGSSGTASTASADGAVIGISMEAQSNSFDKAMQQQLVQDAKDAGFKPLEPTNAGGEASQQISDLQTLISRGAKGLLLVPWDSDALASAVDQASGKGVPVVTPNVGVNSSAAYVNVRPDGTQMGNMQCDALKGQIPDNAQIFYEAGGLSDNVGRDRWQSFDACIQKDFPNATVTMKEGKWDPVTAGNQIETAFGSGQHYDALVLASDSLYIPVALSTLKKLNLLKPVGDPDHIYLSSIDGSPEGLDAIRDGWQDFMVAQPLVEASKLSVDYLKDALDGKTVAPGPTDHNSQIVKADDGSLTDFIPAIAVTKDNVDDKSVLGQSDHGLAIATPSSTRTEWDLPSISSFRRQKCTTRLSRPSCSGAPPNPMHRRKPTCCSKADLRGQASHGIRRLPVLAERLERGVTISGAAPALTWRAPGALDVDGRRLFGPVVINRVIDEIIPRAHEVGIVVAAIRSAGHIGMLAPYVERMAGEDCIGIVLTVSEALVHAWGGSQPVVGTNPIGIAIPTGAEPVVVDMSTASASAGKILDFAARGEAIPPDWAVDNRGRPTTDAAAAAQGSISPFGGAKGYALGLAFGSLVGLLSQSHYGRDVAGTLDVDRIPTKGDVLIAISARAFGVLGGFSDLAEYLDVVRREGTDGRDVLIPGDRARAVRAERLQAGVPIDQALWDRVTDLRKSRTKE